MRLIDQQFLSTPFCGSRRMTACLGRSGETVNRKRVQRLMAKMGLKAIFPRPRTTTVATNGRVYPYLLRDRELTRVNWRGGKGMVDELSSRRSSIQAGNP